jgi:hypothetical protein
MACLGWLVPDLLLLGTQISPLPPHTRRSIGKTTTHTISIHAYMVHTQDMHHTTQALSIRSKHVQISESITISTKENTTVIIAKQFLMAIKPYSQANNLQASI